MKKILCVALHGFLGRGEDWLPLLTHLSDHLGDQRIEFWCPDLLDGGKSLGPEIDFKIWPEKFIKQLDKFDYSDCIILGYSMGGRLAMQTIARYPQKFSGAMFLSVNPLSLSSEEQKLRKVSDNKWEKIFLQEDWQRALELWNEQSIFKFDKVFPTRKEADFSRQALALAFKNWSPRHQVFNLESTVQWPSSIFWGVGEKDPKYLDIMEKLKKSGFSAEFEVIEGYGHRLGFDKCEKLGAWLKNLIVKLSES